MTGFILKDYVLTVSDELWGLLPFKAILKRDKSRDKDRAIKEMLFIYYYSDIKSDYLIIDEVHRTEEIIKDIGLPKDWKVDKVIEEAIEFYKNRSLTVVAKLYMNAMIAANDVADYLLNTKALLEERDKNEKPVYTLPVILSGLSKVTITMKDLKLAEKELVKERTDLEGKMKGKQEMGLFEGGLKFD